MTPRESVTAPAVCLLHPYPADEDHTARGTAIGQIVPFRGRATSRAAAFIVVAFFFPALLDCSAAALLSAAGVVVRTCVFQA